MKKVWKSINIAFIIALFTSTSYGLRTEKVALPPLQSTFNKEQLSLSKITGEILLDENLEDGDASGWSVIDNNTNDTTWSIYESESDDGSISHSGTKSFGCPWNVNGADDWLITPQMNLPEGKTITFSFWAKSYDASYLESFNIKLSTSDKNISDFTTTLQSVSNVAADWTQFTYDLSNYAGQSVYIALQCVSVDKYYLWADDFLCEAEDAGANIPEILSVSYGPPESANTWEKFTIPLVASTFSVSEAEFTAAMEQISMIRIRTEMRDGQDFGAIDNVQLGNLYASYFPSGTEEWSASGDGTMSWESSGGVSGGYLKISDWASGDWHWAVAPTSWTGNLSGIIGQNLEFYYMTNYPSYAAVVEFHTGDANRIILSSEKMSLKTGESATVTVTLDPAVGAETTVNLSSSNTSYITVPGSVTIPAGNTMATFTVTAPNSISSDGTSVITASTAGYSTARLTLNVTQTSNTTLTGKVTDATTGNPIQGVQVNLGDISSTSDSDGNYRLENVPAGALTAEFMGTPTTGNAPLNVQFTDYSTNNTQTVTATNSGYTDYVNRQVQIIEGQENNLDISMSPTLVAGAMRFVLSWDDDPRDIDSYLHTPEIDGTDYYVYYNSKGSADSPPYAVLDVDDQDGYGPETITIHQTVSGTYKYYILKYAGNQLLRESNAVVHIYNENGLLHTIQVPRSGDGEYWNVLELDGDSKSISIINQIPSESPAAMNSKLLHAYRKAPQLVQNAQLALSYEWDFGDGATSTEQHPLHLYESPGLYTVTLKVSDGDKQNTLVKENYINVAQTSNTTLTGKVTDATTGNPIQGVQVNLGDISSTSDSDGNYRLENVPAGALTAEFMGTPTTGNAPLNVQFTDYSTNNTQTVTATNSGYTDYVNRQVQIIEGQENNLDISMSPTLVAGAMRFVLSWDDDPRDIDSYLHTPEIDGTDYYVYYNSKGSADSPPYAVLDVDDQDGYGPETITIHQTVSGTYKYYILKYAGNQLLRESNAVVHIYNENGLLHTIQVPRSGDGEYWNVLELDGDSKSISIINQIPSESPAAMNSKLLHAYRKAPQLVQNAQLALSYEWDFGDGATSTEQHPLHLYESPGLYTVTLKVSDGDKQNTLVKENYINVIQMVTVTDTLLYESFEDDVSNWVIYDNDGDEASWSIYTEIAPYDTVAHTGERGLGVAWNANGNDDWIVTPQIYLPDGDAINFCFWGHSHSSDYPEDFNVKLSTTGNDVEDFTVTLAEVHSAPLEWTEYAYNLDEYIGSNIYLSVQCVSVDKYYLWLDDFLVTSTGVTATDDDLAELPTKFALYQNYPNPFNPRTTIVYELPETQKINLSIYNIKGEIVEQLVAGRQSAGQHKIMWQAEKQPTGVYFVKLTAGNFSSVKKIMFMK